MNRRKAFAWTSVAAVIFSCGSYPASAGEQTVLAEACLKAVHLAEQADTAVISSKQSFPELDPPRAQIRIEYEEIALMQQIRCTFSSPEPPLGLTQICVNNNCDFPPERLEELQVLMQRAGL